MICRHRTASGTAPRPVPEPAAERTAIVQAGRAPLRRSCAAAAVLRCIGATTVLLARRRIGQPVEHLGVALRCDDGSRATVYRETVVRRGRTAAPATVVVEFRLRWISGRGHALFRVESLLHTPLFVGFPGVVSKLWLAHDANGVYRGIYEWDGPALAHHHARACRGSSGS